MEISDKRLEQIEKLLKEVLEDKMYSPHNFTTKHICHI